MRIPNGPRRTAASACSVGLRAETGLRRAYSTLSPAPGRTGAGCHPARTRTMVGGAGPLRPRTPPHIMPRIWYATPPNISDAFPLSGLSWVSAYFLCLTFGIMCIRDNSSRLPSESHSPVGVVEASGHVESAPPGFTQHGRKLDRVAGAARRADGGRHDAWPPNRGDAVLTAYLLAGRDGAALLVGPLRHPVPGRLHAAAVCRRWAGRVPDLIQAEAGRLGRYMLRPLFGDGLGVPDRGGVDGDRLAVPGRPHAVWVRHGAAAGVVVGHH